jgi:hypothetical protein
MPSRLYLDVDNAGRLSRDESGVTLGSLAAASREAIRAASDAARDVQPSRTERVISTSVRDQAGTTLFRAVLTLRCDWPG